MLGAEIGDVRVLYKISAWSGTMGREGRQWHV